MNKIEYRAVIIRYNCFEKKETSDEINTEINDYAIWIFDMRFPAYILYI